MWYAYNFMLLFYIIDFKIYIKIKSAHLALIDSLMIAYSMKAMRLDNVITAVK